MSGRPSSERDGACICDYGPATDGPQEDCPFHGRPYAYWVERVDTLSARLAAVEALIGGPTPPIFLSDRPNKIVRVSHRRRDLGCDMTESMVRVDDIVEALAEPAALPPDHATDTAAEMRATNESLLRGGGVLP